MQVFLLEFLIGGSCKINQFWANISILKPLKTPENQRFPGIFGGYKMEALARNGLKGSCLQVFYSNAVAKISKNPQENFHDRV